MPRAGLGGNGALNYGEAEFQIFQIHLPICILQLKSCKQEWDKKAGKGPSLQYNVRGSFPLEKQHISAKSSCRAIWGPRCWQGAWRRRGRGCFSNAPNAISHFSHVLQCTCTNALLRQTQALHPPYSYFLLTHRSGWGVY